MKRLFIIGLVCGFCFIGCQQQSVQQKKAEEMKAKGKATMKNVVKQLKANEWVKRGDYWEDRSGTRWMAVIADSTGAVIIRRQKNEK